MKTKNVGGHHATPPSTPRSPTSATKAPAPAPAPASPKMTAPPSSPKTGGDGFKQVTTAPQAQPTQTKPPGGANVSADFGKNPAGFAAQNVLNAYNASPPSHLPTPTEGRPFVPAGQSTVTVNAHQRPGGNANLTFNPAGGQGPQAHYLPYLPQNGGRFAGISGVPMHPTANAPTTIVTGQLNGCAVHAFHDPKTQTMSFMHHANFSQNGKQELKDFLGQKENSHLQHLATLGPEQYAHPTGKHGIETGATAFIHYDKPTRPGAQGQWNIVGQLNDWKSGSGPDGRPDLVRPDFSHFDKDKKARPPHSLVVPIPLPSAQ